MKHTILKHEDWNYEIVYGENIIGRHYEWMIVTEITEEDLQIIEDIKEDVRLELNNILSNYFRKSV